MILRFLKWQGIAGLAAAIALAVLLAVQKGDTRHWRRQSSQFEQLYRAEQSAFAGTVAKYRAAAEAARAADLVNAARVKADQARINERTADDFEARLADARARAANLERGRLRQNARPAADPGSRPSTSVPGVAAAAGGSAQAAKQGGLSDQDALIATEQAIQLDELIKWVRRQAAVDIAGPVAPSQKR
jgi:hypothetical protein